MKLLSVFSGLDLQNDGVILLVCVYLCVSVCERESACVCVCVLMSVCVCERGNVS